MKICLGDFDEEEKIIGLRSGIDTAEFLRAQQSQNNFLPWSLVAFKRIVSEYQYSIRGNIDTIKLQKSSFKKLFI